MGYDVIGDVHGQFDKLVGLLAALGYREAGGVWLHDSRQAVFVGDLVDRGPKQVETVALVRAMVDAGTARIVLGNHELNAVCWFTPDFAHPGEFLRPHHGEKGAKNRHQHAAFLDQVGEGSALHAELISWFRTLPVWLDLGGLRVVHACWDERSMEVLRPLLSDTCSLTDAVVVRGVREGDPVYEAIETVVKGPEIALPDGYAYCDKDGHVRHRARFSWWKGDATTLRAGARIPSGAVAPDGTPMPPLPDTPIGDAAIPRYTDAVPVIYGHYWRTGTPSLTGPTSACVDYSAGKGGALVAYRWSGESTLRADNFAAYP